MKQISVDFEFNRPADPGMGLISCALHTGKMPLSYWLRPDQAPLLETLENLRPHSVFIGYEIQLAEARCFAALGLDPAAFHWRDLLAEWRWLRNEDNRYKYGHIVKNGRAFYTVPPARRKLKRMTDEEVTEAEEINAAHLEAMKAERDEENVSFEEAGFSLLDCLYFFEIIDLAGYQAAERVKSEIRDKLIISGTDAEIEARKSEILAYNAADVADLLKLADKITAAMVEVLQEPHVLLHGGDLDSSAAESVDLETLQLRLGAWNSRLAKYAYRGIPIDAERLKTFLRIVPELTDQIKRSWNLEHPEDSLYRVGLPESVLEKRRTMATKSPYIDGAYTKDAVALQRLIGKFCRDSGVEGWIKTRQGAYSTDKKALATYASGENLIKQLERHQGALSNLKAFSASPDGSIDALRYIGSDFRQRPDFGAHGTQTDRNAHKAKSLIFAMTHWMRILVNPEPGYCIAELDYSAEEVFIAAAISSDENMMAAYKSADVYMFFAQLSGMYPADLLIPTEAQRSEEWFKPYKKIRQIAKSTVLGMQFGMGQRTLAASIANVTGEEPDPDGALELIRGYREAYPEYSRMVQRLREAYQAGAGIMLPNGWRLGPNSPSILSASNVPVQGTGSVILQEACRRIDAAEIPIIATLHDSITLYCPEQYVEEMAAEASRLMVEAADDVLGVKGMRVGEAEVVRHGEYWLHGERAARDWPRYKKHFIKET